MTTLAAGPQLQFLDQIPKQLFIGGTWVDSASGKTFDVFDPATEEPLCSVSDASSKEALAALDSAAQAQHAWGESTGRQRYGILMALLDIIQERREDLAAMMTMEAGKPVAESGAEIDLACSFIQYFAEEALRIEGSYQVNPNGGGRMIVTKRPVGTAVLITPWNFPMSMAARKIAPALAAGCTLVVKPAKETPLTMLAFAQMLQEAGLPDGVLNVVTTSTSSQTMEPVIRSGKARKLSFTGSTPVGIKLVEQAAANIMKISMELGGNAPFIVFADADINQAVEGLMATKMRGNGETCTAANRVYVHRSIIDEFTSRVVDRMRGFTLGHGLDREVTLGPLINAKQLATVQGLIDDAVAKGATVSLGGERHGTTGHFLQPTVLTDLPEDARILREEIFGPVAPIIPFDTETEVVNKANDTEFGLSSYVFTENLETALRVSESIDSGLVGLNQGSVSNAAAPFGGTKMSGLGREGGKEGLEEFLETKFIALRLDTTPRGGTA